MTKKKKIDKSEIIKNNPMVDPQKLIESLAELRDLQSKGIDVGPNYNLGSPYTRPTPENEEDSKQRPPIILRNIL